MRLVEKIFGVIAPNACQVCHHEGRLICLWCSDIAFPGRDSRCYRCNTLTSDYRTCSSCYSSTKVARVVISTEYTEHAKQMVHRMKFGYSFEASCIIAEQIYTHLPYLNTDTIITNIPSVSSHVRDRGFDHTERIAKELSRLSGLRYVKLLYRMGQARQVGSSRDQRTHQLKNVFRPKNRSFIEGGKILLIDDMLTTGATIESALSSLKASGAKKVDVAVFTRAK